MKFLSVKKILPILVSAVFFGVALSPTNVSAAKIESKNLTVKQSDFKNGTVTIKDRTLNSLTIKGSGKRSTISLMNVKINGELRLEKGNYVLKSKNSSLNKISMLQNGKITLDEGASLNKRDLKIDVNSGIKATVSLPGYVNKANITLGKKSLLNVKVGSYDKADLVVKKSSADSSIVISGTDEDAKLKSLTIDSAVKGSIKVDVGLLNLTENANGSPLNLAYNADKIDNKSNVEISKKDISKDNTDKKADNDKQASQQKPGDLFTSVDSNPATDSQKKEAAAKFDKEAENIRAAMSVQNARDLLRALDSHVATIGSADLSRFAKAENVNKYNTLKSELNTYDLFDRQPVGMVTLDAVGTVILKQAFEMEVTAVLYKGNNAVNLPDYHNLTPTRGIGKGTTTFSMLKEMRAAGVGEYTVQVKPSNFTYINAGNTLDNKPLKSNSQSVVEMTNPWIRTDHNASIKRSFDGLTNRDAAKEFLNKIMSPDGVSSPDGTVTVKSGILRWNPVADAQFYDIYADFTFTSNEGFLGNKIIVDEGIGVNNERTIQDIPSNNNVSTLSQGTTPRRVLLGSVTTPEIALTNICLLNARGFNADMNNANWHKSWDASADPSTPVHWLIRVKIIPRNISGLKTNSILSLTANNEPVQVTGSVFPAVFVELGYNGAFRDFAEIVLGKTF